jgi:N4-gp56 family major capsid protein
MADFKELVKSLESLRDVLSEKTGDRLTTFDVVSKTNSNDPAIREFQRRCDDLIIVSKILGKDPRELKLYKTLFDPVSEIRKALTTTDLANWIPSQLSAQLVQDVRLALKVAALHPRIDMPTNPFNIPVFYPGSKAKKKVNEGQPPTAPTGTLTANSITLNATTLIQYLPITYEVNEDTIIPLLPLIRHDIVEALARAQEDATINGSVSGTGFDSDWAQNDARASWNGYRKLVASGLSIDLAGFSGGFGTVALRAVRTALGRYGVNPDDLAWIVGPTVYNLMLSLPEVITVDKYGPNATILKGELGRFDGIPIIVSEYVREDLNANGVYDGTTTRYTMAILVNKNGFVYGDRNDATIETQRNIVSQVIDIVASQRIAFAQRIPGAKVVAILYGIPTSL